MDAWFSGQLNHEIEKLKSCDYTSYQNFYNETSQYLYGIIWNMVQDQGTADTLINELYTNIYATIASELTDNRQFYVWAGNKAQMLATTYLTTHRAAGAYAVAGGVVADEAVAAVAANAGVDAAVGAGQAGVGAAAYGAGQAGVGTVATTAGQVGVGTAAATAGQAGMGTAAAGAGQAGVGTVAGVSGIGGASGAGIASGIAHVGMSLGAKIAIGIAATAVAVGGGLGLHHVLSDKKKPADTEQTTEIVEEITTELEVATELDAVETAEEITDSNPVSVGYCLERVTDDSDKGKVQARIDYLRFVGDALPELKNSFETWQNEYVNEYYAWIDEYSVIAEKDYVDHYTIDGKVQCNRADEKVLSVSYSRSYYAGGGLYGSIKSASFDVGTGKLLTLDDIGDVKGNIKTALVNYFNSLGSDSIYLTPGWDTLIDEKLADNSLNWGMAYGYLYVRFSQGEIASNAAGEYLVQIPYSELPGLKAEYLPDKDVYFGNLGFVSELFDESNQYDINGDGVTESVGVYRTYEFGNENASLHLVIDGTAVTEEIAYREKNNYINGYTAYLCSKAGTTYVILEILGDNLQSDYYIYDITSKTAVEIQRFTDVSALPVDPYATMRKTRIDVLGTYTGYKRYSLGPEGLTTDYHYYIFQGADDITLTAKTDISCKFEKDGMLVEDTIAAGTTIHPVECDTENKIFVFRMEDGMRGRFYYVQDENGIMINGVPETELFENLPYTE